jgi:hypothetical protein
MISRSHGIVISMNFDDHSPPHFHVWSGSRAQGEDPHRPDRSHRERLDEKAARTGTIAWPGEVDLAPDTLYERVKTGEWPSG